MRETTSFARFSCPATFGFGMAHPGGGIAKVVWVAREVTPRAGRSGGGKSVVVLTNAAMKSNSLLDPLEQQRGTQPDIPVTYAQGQYIFDFRSCWENMDHATN